MCLSYLSLAFRLLCLDVDKIISMKANGEDMYTLPLSTTQTHSGLVAFRVRLLVLKLTLQYTWFKIVFANA